MRILSLTAENLKRIVVVQIVPDGNLVEITGPNGAGKTSVLDAIWWALAGASHIQAAPIRAGASEARIRLDLGELIVRRTFKRAGDGKVTTSITVTDADHKKFRSPQHVLDALFSELTFDPLAFARMMPRQQFDALRGFVPGIDFDAVEAANAADYAKRTEVNRLAKADRAAAGLIAIRDDAPTERVDERALVNELNEAGRFNLAAEKLRGERERTRQGFADRMAEASRLRGSAVDKRRRIVELEAEIIRDNDAAAAIETEVDGARETFDALPPVPDPIATDGIVAKIDEARSINRAVDAAAEAKAEKARLTTSAEEHEATSEALTGAINDRNAAKERAVAAAEMPVDGITFGDGEILLNGLPFDQASDAEQLRASIAIAMASNSNLRVIRVRDGSLLDHNSMAILAEAAAANDYQVWIERVDESGDVGFVLEDGRLKGGQ